MNAPREKRPVPAGPTARPCLAREVVHTLAQEPALEAVTIDRARKTISVATLGRANTEELTHRLASQLQAVHQADVRHACLLLEGSGDCRSCETPLLEADQKKITVRHEGPTTTIARVTCPTAPKFWRWRDLPLPRVVPRDVEYLEEAGHIEEHINEWKLQLAAAVLCGALGLAAYFSPAPLGIWLFAGAYLAGGFYPAQEVWERFQKRAIDVHFLMLAVAAGAASIGAWAEGATLLFLFSLSGALEHFALGRTQREIRSLFRDAPKTALALDEAGREREVPVAQIHPGMKLLIKPGALFPVDAEISKGATAADESNLTGEAVPVEKHVGDTALAGTLNLWGAVEAVVTRPAAESALQKIIELIRHAQQQKAPAQLFADKFSSIYTYAVIGLAFVMFFVWWLGFRLAPFEAAVESQSAFYRTMTLLVVASPCALVLSIPSAVLAAIAWGARHGILFRGGAAVEKLAETEVVALDKTGTLTTGELRVEKVESFPPGREEEIARLAFSLEKLSTHPLARAITRHGKQQQFDPVDFEHFESVTGLGLRARRNGSQIFLGKRDWVLNSRAAGRAAASASEPGTPPDWSAPMARTMDAGFSEIWLAQDDLVGRIILRDDVRPQARTVVEELRGEALKTVVLTGDRKTAAENLREQLHLDDVRAELKPEEKVAVIQEFSRQNRKVAMIGDGVNDAPSLAAAHVGVAMGARGADAALEQADVVLMHDRLENFLAAFRLSRRARRIIRWNLVISLGTVVVLVTLAMLAKIPLTLGVVGHEGSTVVVVMNSLRLLFGNVEALKR
ncbi:MAG: cation-translocating P-type ATPase [Verrucomicrobiota bacterium]|nr:cation-translocating P-type ATPase [Verrucomicrobiota bacterium]